MPSINIYTSKDRADSLESLLPELKELTAKELSCTDRTLGPTDMSIRIFVPHIASQVADIELEMKAHAYKERIDRQDLICRSVKEYIQGKCPEAGSVLVLLQLSELGYSGGA